MSVEITFQRINYLKIYKNKKNKVLQTKRTKRHKLRRGDIIYSYQRVSLSHTHLQLYKRHAHAIFFYSRRWHQTAVAAILMFHWGRRSMHSSFLSLSLSLSSLSLTYTVYQAVTSVTSSHLFFRASTSRRRTSHEASAPIIINVAKYLSAAAFYKLWVTFSFIIIYLFIFNYYSE